MSFFDGLERDIQRTENRMLAALVRHEVWDRMTESEGMAGNLKFEKHAGGRRERLEKEKA